MPSKEFNAFVRNLRSKPQENPQKMGFAPLRALQTQHSEVAWQGEAGVLQKPQTMQGIATEWLIPEGAPENTLLLFLHGGSWGLGGLASTRLFLAPMAKQLRMQALSIEYRLMPEHPFPQGLMDCKTVYLHLLQTGWKPGQIVLCGESAGANLALALALLLKKEKVPLPGAVVAISPPTFLDTLEGSHTALAPLDAVLAEDSFIVTEVAAQYAPGEDPKNPYLSPLYGDLSNLPPLLLTVGTDEILFDDAVRFYQKARLCGVQAQLLVGDHMTHCWPIFVRDFPEAQQAVACIGRFIQEQLGDGCPCGQANYSNLRK